jgi:hypothetical protein
MVQFVPDSGATNHMVSNADYLTQSLNPVTGNPSVQSIDGKSLEVVATGSMLIRDYLGRELLLTEVLLVPDMQVIVVSVSLHRLDYHAYSKEIASESKGDVVMCCMKV